MNPDLFCANSLSAPPLNTPIVISVSALANTVRRLIESGCPPVWITGEISNLSYAPSGHVYFSLKDASAQLRCTLWRSRAQTLGWRLENGQRVEARVTPTLYEARGDFQLNVEAVRRAGMGSLYEQFLQLKAKLEAEGLFAAEAKRALPPFPRKIGVVTSQEAAAWHDVHTAFARRAPHIQLVLAHSPVQGVAAVPGVVAALRTLAQTDCELIIVCRGGGSLEDLWAFNDEAIARAIRTSPVPVISGIGHETDFTIADFAADLRAPTPTAAAELASPDRNGILAWLDQQKAQLRRAMRHRIENHTRHLDLLQAQLLHPQARLDRQRAALHQLHHRLELATQRRVENHTRCLERLANSLQHLNPSAVLERGYSLVRNADGQLVRNSETLSEGDMLAIQFAVGQTDVRVVPT